MKKQILIIAAGLLLTFSTQAQISKILRSYEEQQGVSVTHLDKNVYGLYKKKYISPEAETTLKQIQEVNILTSVNQEINPKIDKEISKELKTNYQLVKSRNSGKTTDKIYIKTSDDKVSDLVVWVQAGDKRLNLIELRGSINLENIASLSKALNINGLSALSSLSPQNEEYTNDMRTYNYGQLSDLSRRMQEIAEHMRQHFSNLPDFNTPEMQEHMQQHLKQVWKLQSDPSVNIDSLFDSMKSGFGTMSDLFEYLGDQNLESLNEGAIITNSVQITEENGKTKIKIDAKNSEIHYIVDGIESEDGEVIMPEKIKNVKVVRDPQDPKKSYLIIMSSDPIGKFISLKNDILKFTYNDQEYQFDLKKSGKPLIWSDGILAYNFDIKPSPAKQILQIRPVSEAEKKTGAFKSAEIIINTKLKSLSESMQEWSDLP